MAHLDEGTLQGYLDAEITGRDRAMAAEHLLVCADCRAELDALRRANEHLAEALAALDTATPAAAAPAARRRRRGAPGVGSLGRAAVLVLLLAAAASATVPGSPLREWIAQVVTGAPAAPAEQPGPALDQPRAPDEVAAPAGIAVPGLRDVDVHVTGVQGAAIRLIPSEVSGVAVSAQGSARDPLFRMAAGRIEVIGGAGGEIIIEVPRTGATVRLLVDGRSYAEVVNGEVTVIEPAEREGQAVVWR